MTKATLSGAKKHGVMMYQSFSGDAEVGTSIFDMTVGSITTAEGPMFYSTNTDAVIKLKGVQLNAATSTVLKASEDRWNTTGSNGAFVSFIADEQNLISDVICDNISTKEFS